MRRASEYVGVWGNERGKMATKEMLRNTKKLLEDYDSSLVFTTGLLLLLLALGDRLAVLPGVVLVPDGLLNHKRGKRCHHESETSWSPVADRPSVKRLKRELPKIP